MRLWREPALPGGMELLRASCVDHRYPAHSHDEFVVAAFEGGAQRHRIGRQGGVARAGTLMVIPPGEVHTGEAEDAGGGWDYCALYPSPAFLEALADDVLGGRGALDFGREALRHDPALARGLVRALAAIERSRDVTEKRCVVVEAIGRVIARHGRRSARGAPPPAPTAPVSEALDFLEAHHGRGIAVADVAAAVGLSEFHFMRTFRARTGLSVHRALTQVRLRRAKDLLARGVDAAEAAVAVGLFDQSHLIRLFRAHFGVTPGAFAAASRRAASPPQALPKVSSKL